MQFQRFPSLPPAVPPSPPLPSPRAASVTSEPFFSTVLEDLIAHKYSLSKSDKKSRFNFVRCADAETGLCNPDSEVQKSESSTDQQNIRHFFKIKEHINTEILTYMIKCTEIMETDLLTGSFIREQ